MVNDIPENWSYNEDLEMLFLFYQLSDELLSYNSADTYSLPLHNSLTLLREIRQIYQLLERYGIIADYYSKYIPIIIDELIDSMKDDYVLKKVLGNRYERIKTGLVEAKSNHVLLERWINLLNQCCTFDMYSQLLQKEIVHLIMNTNDKQKLMKVSKDYYVCLINIGYSREFLYQTVKRFFTNKKERIGSLSLIKDFLSKFSGKMQNMEFLILMDITTLNYISNLGDNIRLSETITKIEKEQLIKEYADNDYTINDFLTVYDNLSKDKGEKISIIHLKAKCLDYFTIAKEFKESVDCQLALSGYFKHFYKSKQIFKVIARYEQGKYFNVESQGVLVKRPFIEQSKIDTRFKNLIMGTSMSQETKFSLNNAIVMHDESINIKSPNLMLRNFWTSLETLFLQPAVGTSKDNIINSTIEIIQKTYILKVLRNIFTCLKSCVPIERLRKLNINEFSSFVLFFASNDAKSKEMKTLFSELAKNPLLRSKMFMLRMDLKNGTDISKYLDKHRTRVYWQLERIYRCRNIATHMGIGLQFSSIVVNHLHNYFDFAINYMLCKSENGDYIESVPTLVFECKNDNTIHQEMLKLNEELHESNYIELLFGPDSKIINYEFE